MSTKSTIMHGPDFHFYSEGFDDDHVYLELTGTEFDVEDNTVSVAIPIAIWEVIRDYTSISFDLVDKTEDELLRQVETAVEERMFAYAKSEGRRKGLMAMSGAWVYGSADSPREEQVSKGLFFLRREQERQRMVRDGIAELKKLNNK